MKLLLNVTTYQTTRNRNPEDRRNNLDHFETSSLIEDFSVLQMEL